MHVLPDRARFFIMARHFIGDIFQREKEIDEKDNTSKTLYVIRDTSIILVPTGLVSDR